jgi:hypothetical protein
MSDYSIPLLALVAGLVFGLGYFYVLKRSVTLLLQPGNRSLGIALTLGRLILAALLLWQAAHLGAMALLSGLAGFVVARFIALRLNKEAAP